jgi:hypothetical protein
VAQVGARLRQPHGGTDVLLMAADHALRRDLSRRIRDDLMQLGIVAPGSRSASPTALRPAPAT